MATLVTPSSVFPDELSASKLRGHTVSGWCSRLELGEATAPAPRTKRFSVIRENLRMSLQEPSPNFSTPQSPKKCARKRPVSERRIQANRRNALRSTAPKSARGKRTVARNAIKHGLLAREVVITAGDGEENLEEFHSLLEGLWDSYEPIGVVEESLVQAIAACWWRKARVIRAENGEIRKRLDTIAVDRALRDSDKGNLALLSSEMDFVWYNPENPADGKVSTTDRWSAMQVAQSNLRGHHSGLAYLRVLLQKAKSEIVTDSYMSEKIQKKIFHALGLLDYFFALICFNDGPPETKMEDRPTEKTADKPTNEERAHIIASIDDRLERISTYEGYASEREKLAVDAEARSFSFPPV